VPHSSSHALDDLCSLVLGDHSLHLKKEAIFGTLTNRAIDEVHFDVSFRQLFDDHLLMDEVPCEPIRTVD